MSEQSADETSAEERVDEKLDQLLQGMRVILPGVQVIFAFLLTVPFQRGWDRLDSDGRTAYLVATLASAAASVFLIAPAAQHRLLFRDSQAERMLRRANRYGFLGVIAVAVAIAASVFLVLDLVRGPAWAMPVAVIVSLAALWLWVVEPWLTRERTTGG